MLKKYTAFSQFDQFFELCDNSNYAEFTVTDFSK